MEEYTIHCTPEQTKKALELGAPLYLQTVDDDDEFIEVIDEGVYKYYEIPTAEQMIGWLEDKHIDCFVGKQFHERFVATVCVNEVLIYSNPCDSRKEATLSAIDAALDYLSKK